MNKITIPKDVRSDDIFPEIEKNYQISISNEIKEFIEDNAGGYPVKHVIDVNGTEFEIRVFLSLDRSDPYFFIGEPLKFFLSKTKGRLVPFARDSEDNYYCVCNDTGKVYFWSSDLDEFYFLSPGIHAFSELFFI